MTQTEIKRYPDGASDEYIKARKALLDAEYSLSKQTEKVAALRRELPPGAVMKEYVFDGPNNTKVSLADLAADGRSLITYNLMFAEKDDEPCGMCAMFVDGQNGVGKHLNHLFNFAVIGKAPIAKLEAYAKKRGWTNFKLLSSANNTFNKDMHIENPEWEPDAYSMPLISVFKKDAEGTLRHVYSQSSFFEQNTQRGMDALVPVYNFLDLTPEGRGNFMATNDYIFE